MARRLLAFSGSIKAVLKRKIEIIKHAAISRKRAQRQPGAIEAVTGFKDVALIQLSGEMEPDAAESRDDFKARSGPRSRGHEAEFRHSKITANSWHARIAGVQRAARENQITLITVSR